ncbi:FAD-dependent monooxygenase [Uliginosibacterium sp. H3]|uniref:FAD-dependent monooxygenase n=1 Tax=Uliginosibacterium silvisoli TaxID=3114758 RepID=A0ABU6K1U4_9RHOO|nr:FAD-dependent monooxygenase [Uliginosibacterium sp. H3]
MNAADDKAILIVGAGPIGLAAALRLSAQGNAVRIFDARPADPVRRDTRVLALSHGSRQLLETLGAWPAGAATPIETIHVSQRGALGRTELRHAEYGLPALGYVLPASALLTTLSERLAAQNLHIEFDAHVDSFSATPDHITLGLRSASGETRKVSGSLAVCCEGGIQDSDEDHKLVSRDYDQHALLLRATPVGGHHNLARERFTPDGPIALLPLGRDYAVVWTVDPAQLAALKALDDASLLTRLHAAFGGTVRLADVRERSSYPLSMRLRRNTVGERTVWLGNAAQTLHPVAGQGFNLGLRDVWELAETLRGAADAGSADVLSRHARRRRADRWGTAGFTDSLVRLFSNDNTLLGHARGAGLLALDMLPPLRHFVAKRMIFGARAWP